MNTIVPEILLLKSGDLSSDAVAGAKAYRLQQLILQDFSVPDFFCLGAVSHKTYINLPEDEKLAYRNQLQKKLAAHVEAYFSGVSSFSVRTSSMVEDSDVASFAGQFKTLLRIPPQKLGEAVLQCWDAFESSNIAMYKEGCSLDGDTGFVGIIIQKMIEADVAGVAFSANPQGILNESVIVCGQGTGDKVVADTIPTTTYYFNQDSKQFYYEQEPGAVLLDGSLLQQLETTLRKLGAEKPVDIEYAIQDNRLWILQQRPITALYLQCPTILDNSNIVESYGGICLPLTISFARHVYTKIFQGLARRCLPKGTLTEYGQVLKEMVNSVNGRMYYQISNWYTVLKFLPMQSKIIPVWQKMMGVQSKVYSETANALSIWERLQTHCKILVAAFGIPKKMDSLEVDFAKAQELFYKEFYPGKDPEQLVKLFEALSEIVLRGWDITLLNDIYAFVFSGLLEREFKKSSMEDYREQSNRYLSGNREIESMKPVREAWALAEELRSDEVLRMRLEGIKSNSEAESYLAFEEDPFAKRIRNYLRLYGDRSHDELKLETQTFRSNPLEFIHLLLAYARDSSPLNAGTLPRDAEDSLSALGFFRRKSIRYLSKKARLGIANREKSRFNRGRIFGMVRRIFSEMGITLHRAGLIEHPRDVFYLNMEELLAYASQKEEGETFIQRIALRKKEYLDFAQLPAYSRLVFAGKPFDKHPRKIQIDEDISTEDVLWGTPCSQGVTEGEVIIVTTPVKADLVRGKIIVAHTTDPGWVFLLAVAKGVIAEKGSLLSHTAIISRELGLPSVVGVDYATERLKDGDYVRLDGGKGTVEKYND